MTPSVTSGRYTPGPGMAMSSRECVVHSIHWQIPVVNARKTLYQCYSLLIVPIFTGVRANFRGPKSGQGKLADLDTLAWINRVKQSGLGCFNAFLSTLDERMEEILNYFIHRQTSGFVEGLNNKIKVIKRRCYGILNPDHLFQRILLDLSGYSLFS